MRICDCPRCSQFPGGRQVVSYRVWWWHNRHSQHTVSKQYQHEDELLPPGPVAVNQSGSGTTVAQNMQQFGATRNTDRGEDNIWPIDNATLPCISDCQEYGADMDEGLSPHTVSAESEAEGSDDGNGGEIAESAEDERYKYDELFEDELVLPVNHDFREQSTSRLPEQAFSWIEKVHIFVLFLTTFHGITNQAAALLLLFVSRFIIPLLHASGVLDPGTDVLVTLPSIRRSLGIQDTFTRYLVCPHCVNLFPWNGKGPNYNTRHRCTCNTDLYCNGKARQTYPHRSLAVIFASILSDPYIEQALDEWREDLGNNESAHPFIYDEVWSGSKWLADCCQTECDSNCTQRHRAFVDGGLNLKITLSVDWFGPFRGKFHGWHSTGAILLRIDNLPARLTTLDRQSRGIHLVGLLPGPKEQMKEKLQKYLQLIVDELKEFDTGVKLVTSRFPQGKFFPDSSSSSIFAAADRNVPIDSFSGQDVL